MQKLLKFYNTKSTNHFTTNLCSAIAVCCFFEDKPQALQIHVEKKTIMNLSF